MQRIHIAVAPGLRSGRNQRVERQQARGLADSRSGRSRREVLRDRSCSDKRFAQAGTPGGRIVHQLDLGSGKLGVGRQRGRVLSRLSVSTDQAWRAVDPSASMSVAAGRCRLAPYSPSPVEALPCGSRSIRRTRSVRSTARDVARLIAVVVLPTPPFWLAIARTCGIWEAELPRPTGRASQFMDCLTRLIWLRLRISPRPDPSGFGMRLTDMCHRDLAAVNSSSAFRPFRNRHLPSRPSNGCAQSSSRAKGARARAVTTSAGGISVSSILLLRIVICAPLARAASRRKLHFRASASTSVTCLQPHIARIRPGKPAPLPRSVMVS